jgi:putative oxidoreductase
MRELFDLIARILVSIIFFFEAYDSIAYFKLVKETMTDYGITWSQNFLLIGAIFVLIVGATFLLIGYRVGFACTILLLYWLPVTFIVYSWWNDPEDVRRLHSLIFMKNLAIAGALLKFMINGSGKYSIKRMFRVARIPKGDT